MGDPLRPLYLRVALNDRDCCFVSLPPNTAAPVISASRISLFRAARAGDTNQDHASDSTIPPHSPWAALAPPSWFALAWDGSHAREPDTVEFPRRFFAALHLSPGDVLVLDPIPVPQRAKRVVLQPVTPSDLDLLLRATRTLPPAQQLEATLLRQAAATAPGMTLPLSCGSMPVSLRTVTCEPGNVPVLLWSGLDLEIIPTSIVAPMNMNVNAAQPPQPPQPPQTTHGGDSPPATRLRGASKSDHQHPDPDVDHGSRSAGTPGLSPGISGFHSPMETTSVVSEGQRGAATPACDGDEIGAGAGAGNRRRSRTGATTGTIFRGTFSTFFSNIETQARKKRSNQDQPRPS